MRPSPDSVRLFRPVYFVLVERKTDVSTEQVVRSGQAPPVALTFPYSAWLRAVSELKSMSAAKRCEFVAKKLSDTRCVLRSIALQICFTGADPGWFRRTHPFQLPKFPALQKYHLGVRVC